MFAFRLEELPPLVQLEREWRRLEILGNPSFFTSWQWIGTFLTAVPTAQRPKLLRGSVSGNTVALALLGANRIRRRRGLVRSRGLFLNETGDLRFDALTIEHNGILAVAEWEPTAWDELLRWFAGLGREADELYLSGLPRPLPKRTAHWGLRHRVASLPSYSIDLGLLEDSDGELYPVLSANARQQLRRAVRYFERFGVLRLAEAATVNEALQFFGEMKKLHCASWERRGRAHSFTGEFFEMFHRLLIDRSFAEGGTRLLRASAGDRILGYLYNFRLNNRIYAYQSGFDDADPRERPGVVMHCLAVRHAFQSGARVYDFMAGRNRLKESFATRCEPMQWHIVQQPRVAFRLEHFGRRLKEALQRKRSCRRADETMPQQGSTTTAGTF
jgi:CelD/BcsL family acetyltransferase involved in cellulose biosynthesis